MYIIHMNRNGLSKYIRNNDNGTIEFNSSPATLADFRMNAIDVFRVMEYVVDVYVMGMDKQEREDLRFFVEKRGPDNETDHILYNADFDLINQWVNENTPSGIRYRAQSL